MIRDKLAGEGEWVCAPYSSWIVYELEREIDPDQG